MYTIAVYVSKVVVLPILIMGAAATLRKWIRRNDKKTLLDLWLVIRSRWLVLMLASAGYLALLLGCSYAVNQKMMPAFSLKLNYEEASKGLFPNKTRFNASELLRLRAGILGNSIAEMKASPLHRLQRIASISTSFRYSLYTYNTQSGILCV